jgi:hypothetical protein
MKSIDRMISTTFIITVLDPEYAQAGASHVQLPGHDAGGTHSQLHSIS